MLPLTMLAAVGAWNVTPSAETCSWTGAVLRPSAVREIGALSYATTYPDGRVVIDAYDTALDKRLGRPTAVADVTDGTPFPATDDTWGTSGAYLEAYSYLGLSTIIQRLRPEEGEFTYRQTSGDTVGTEHYSGMTLRTYGLSSSDSGDKYTGLDQFGRVIDEKWYAGTADVIGAAGASDEYTYTFDRDGNPTSKVNGLHSALSEVYGYDSLNRLTGVQRGGTISGSGGSVSMSSPTWSQSYVMDALGNILQQTTTASGTTVENRTYDMQNRLTSTGPDHPITYDSDGNELTIAETETAYSYDAWNHVVEASADSYDDFHGTDALGRQIIAGETYFYYDQNWQDIEERSSDTGDVQVQNVWSNVYVDALVERDRDVTTGTDGEGHMADGSVSGGLEERLYAQQDANFNTTSLVTADGTGSVVERVSYAPYGDTTFYTSTWGSRAGSAYANQTLFQGLRADASTTLFYARNRWYDADQARWTQADPSGWPEGQDRSRALSASPQRFTDPWGKTPMMDRQNDDYGFGGGGAGGVVIVIGLVGIVEGLIGAVHALQHAIHNIHAWHTSPPPPPPPDESGTGDQKQPKGPSPRPTDPEGNEIPPEGKGSRAQDQLESIDKAQRRLRQGDDEQPRIIDQINQSEHELKKRLRGPYDPGDWDVP